MLFCLLFSLSFCCSCLIIFIVIIGPSSQDGDSDEEWPELGAGGEVEDEVGVGGEVEVDPEDEKAIQMFMNKNPPVR